MLIIAKEGPRQTSTQEYLRHLQQYLRLLEPLILSETRIVRRLGMFAYSFCFRRVK